LAAHTGTALSVLFALRNAEALVVYNTLAFFGTLALLATAISQGTEHRVLESRFRELAHSAAIRRHHHFVGMIALLLSDVSFRQVAGARGLDAISAIRAALVAIPLLLVFGSLFASADPVFARLASDVFRNRRRNGRVAPAVSGIIAWSVGGLLRATVLSSGRSTYVILFPDGALGLTEVATALGSLVALFGAFVIVQLRYFFGGDALVQATAGMSYADYARRGFFELVTVSALVLPVLLSANALLRRATPRADVVFRALSGTLLGLLGIIMYSDIARMQPTCPSTAEPGPAVRHGVWDGWRSCSWLPRRSSAVASGCSRLVCWCPVGNADRAQRGRPGGLRGALQHRASRTGST
jgi:hypothetical protein